jgi:hypothetical protein
MTNEFDKERMLDAIGRLRYKKYSDAKFKLQSEGRYNKGTQKALDSFYNKLTLKNGTTISRTSKGQVIVQGKEGKFRSAKGLGQFIKKFKEMNERK